MIITEKDKQMDLSAIFKNTGDKIREMADGYMASPLVTNEALNKGVSTALYAGGVATYFTGMALHNEAVMMGGLGIAASGHGVAFPGSEHRRNATLQSLAIPVKNDRN